MTSTIIIPAYNEATRIERCLTVLLEEADADEFDVVVACNGCTDNTAELARQFADTRSDVRVLEVTQASKIAALNGALAMAKHRNCLFIDADIELSTKSARRLVEVLSEPGVLAASTALELDMTGANAVSRSYHRFWEQLPSIKSGLAGRGVYAISSAGRDRLTEFPAVTADDRYVHLLFQPSETRTVTEVSSLVAAARTGRELISRKTRVFAGNDELGTGAARTQDGSWRDVLRDSPSTARDLPAYLLINAIAKVSARRSRGKSIVWSRDESTR